FTCRMTYRDASGEAKRGRIIVAGGEILLDGGRESVLYPALAQLQRKYSGGVELIVQTTGDTLTEKHIVELLERGVSVITVSGMDEYHEGFDTEAARDRLTRIFLKHGMERSTPPPRPVGRYFDF